MTTLTKTIYIADDGKEFDSEEACREYEEKRTRKILTKAHLDDDNWMTLLQAKNGTYYIQVDTGDYRSGGTVFDGTFKQFAKKYLTERR